MKAQINFLILAVAGAGTIALPIPSADAKPLRIPVMAMGVGNGPDRESAKSDAADNARAQLLCAGTLEGVHVVPTGCVKLGSDKDASYSCTAAAKATCVLGS
jgi:hypothetical protein